MKRSRIRRAVKRRKDEKSSFFSGKEKKAAETGSKGAFFQAKLDIGDPNDASEREADNMADQVVHHSTKPSQKTAFSGSSVQRQEKKKEEPKAKGGPKLPEKEEKPKAKRIQKKGEEKKEEPKAKLIRRQAGEEEEPAAKLIHRKGEEKEEPKAKIATKGEEKKEEPKAKLIQMQAEKEEEPAAKLVQRKGEEKKEEPKAKLESASSSKSSKSPVVQAKGESKGGDVKQTLETMIQETKGMGMELPNDLREEMEGKFKADFSKVRIHTGKEAVEMTSMIKAHAFTHGYDIYFNEGRYKPESLEGKHLLAHELTHVVQQKG